ncbi:MAG: GNAT family acetyltransferase [Lachnospiraceae bacterium]|nr:GNAT family acetyltransferase [Lachnospiraceae bacterium]
MPITDKFFAINIRKYLALGDDQEAGKPALVKLLSGFSCPKNPDVERFLKNSAIEFTKKNQSVTYLVFSKANGEMLGYFTLALKPLTIRGETVSKTTKRKLLRISELDENSDTYTMSAYLIAQLGKNYTGGRDKEIAGNTLIELAWMMIEKAQYMFGGMVTFLEAENEEKLLSFYRGNRFLQFDTRQTTSDTDESHELVQILRLL